MAKWDLPSGKRFINTAAGSKAGLLRRISHLPPGKSLLLKFPSEWGQGGRLCGVLHYEEVGLVNM